MSVYFPGRVQDAVDGKIVESQKVATDDAFGKFKSMKEMGFMAHVVFESPLKSEADDFESALHIFVSEHFGLEFPQKLWIYDTRIGQAASPDRKNVTYRVYIVWAAYDVQLKKLW